MFSAMDRTTLSIVVFLAVVSSLCVHSVAGNHTSGNSVTIQTSEVPEVFLMDNPNMLLSNYPPTRDFTFRMTEKPLDPKLDKYVRECMSEKQTDFQYQAVSHVIQEHYQCDVRPFWKEFNDSNKKDTGDLVMFPENPHLSGGEVRLRRLSTDAVQEAQAAQQASGQIEAFSPWEEEARRMGQRLVACQQAEVTEGCVLGDLVISCVRNKVKRDLSSKVKSEMSGNVLRGMGHGKGKNHFSDFAREAKSWTANVCRFMAEHGHCERRFGEVPDLQGITRLMEYSMYRGCY
eukprot:GHVS01076101.1.p1 GENE.GHVS01076101.1~~GHVS01076101.1.p1  ORF type:complete len:289 (-),score=34.19 GHVS01076101.1:979-1845(-)